jgi:hypothetical protein
MKFMNNMYYTGIILAILLIIVQLCACAETLSGDEYLRSLQREFLENELEGKKIEIQQYDTKIQQLVNESTEANNIYQSKVQSKQQVLQHYKQVKEQWQLANIQFQQALNGMKATQSELDYITNQVMNDIVQYYRLLGVYKIIVEVNRVEQQLKKQQLDSWIQIKQSIESGSTSSSSSSGGSNGT